MRIILLVLLFFSLSSQANEAPKPSISSKLSIKSMLLDIENVNDEFVIAVGSRGHILKINSKEQWQQMQSPVQSTLTAVDFVSATHGWAVGHDSVILHTSDGGITWQIQQYLPEQQKPLMDVAFKNKEEGIAIGAYGLFYRTTDGGNTWQREYHTSLLLEEDKQYLEELKREDEQAYLEERASILPHFNRIILDGVTTYMVGELGLIAKSNDFGKSWQRFEEIYHGSFYDLARTKQGNLIAVGLRGNSFRSVENGAPWQPVETGVTALLNTIVQSSTEQIFVLGNNGTLLISDDDGQTYQLVSQEDGKALLSGTEFKGQLFVASEVGLKVLQVIK